MDGVNIDHHFHQQHHVNHGHFATQQLPSQNPRKRKAESAPDNNERLSKRLSLLNLEQSGQKLYVPVENPDSQQFQQPLGSSSSKNSRRRKQTVDDDAQMQLDDTKYKVYIYNLDDELSSSDNEDGGAEEGKLVFLPDIEKHLRNTRIPTRVLDPGRLDEMSSVGKELVLYQLPSSLSVPEEHDSVRKAILEARERARERQRAERERQAQAGNGGVVLSPVSPPPHVVSGSVASPPGPGLASQPLLHASRDAAMPVPEDPDAMELD
ncbi:hypothetical protein C7999DRAFT_26968 [Corynascus novoguineensis]|uniref:Uncharacterized protein n=1 Tax=Corynascus novoguineensis TaxID=1126955 RepID=A0AAN7D1X0_9PEZI|nr:hypothetical protein C7999DRAFT_26968 [Corynascus novoguineensis]